MYRGLKPGLIFSTLRQSPPACGYGGVHTHGAESLGGPGTWPRSSGNNQRSVFREGLSPACRGRAVTWEVV